MGVEDGAMEGDFGVAATTRTLPAAGLGREHRRSEADLSLALCMP